MYGLWVIIHYKWSCYLLYPHILPTAIPELGWHAKFDEWGKKEVEREQLLIHIN